MNTPSHIFVSLLIGLQFTQDPLMLFIAVLAGILPDLDHLPHITKALKTGRFGSSSRSFFHELIGLSIFTTLSLFTGDLFPLVFFPLLSHYLLDYMTRPTRPFYPFDKRELHLGIYPKSLKWMTIIEVPLTCLLGLIVFYML
ncbi:metal-dependent hydrolase [Candidatus Altiarchaeota archaeon]